MNNDIHRINIEEFKKRAVDFHCHGVGRFDFTELPEINLEEVESILAQRAQQCILTLYLPKQNFECFLELISYYHSEKLKGHFKHVLGFALEGPLLASHGGTPEKGVWLPSQEHWEAISKCGKKGLIYVVLSPDIQFSKNPILQEKPTNITKIVETLLSGGVLPAPGHFTKEHPKESANLLQHVFDIVREWGECPTITDHLFNDMPRNFKHCWRTHQERLVRDQEIALMKIDEWNLDLLDSQLGAVPATMIRNAHSGVVKICQNFDGEHVDSSIAKRAVELIGAENMLMMTDSIESRKLAGRSLHMKEASSLLYQDEGIVAAGSLGIEQQVKNMVKMGLTKQEIQLITDIVPKNLLNQQEEFARSCLDSAYCV